MQDKNFDDLKAKFEKNIYDNIKGQVRSRVLLHHVEHFLPELKSSPLSCADIGGGLGQFSEFLAGAGHSVDYMDLSEEMTQAAKQNFAPDVPGTVNFQSGAFQDLLDKKYDFINCQAVLEWLAEPEKAISLLARHLKPSGTLLLMFYNKHSIKMRNLVLGNLNAASGPCKGDGTSLTPINPQCIDDVFAQLQENKLKIAHWFGVRCFTDFQQKHVRERLGVDALVDQEIELSNQDPYRFFARYIGVIAKFS